jgi:hypothetical protein
MNFGGIRLDGLWHGEMRSGLVASGVVWLGKVWSPLTALVVGGIHGKVRWGSLEARCGMAG